MDSKLYKKVTNAWVMYDWANSAFATTIMAGFMPVYFRFLAGEAGLSITFAALKPGLLIEPGRSLVGDVEVVDITPTTVLEQRATEWMRFESLEQALDPVDGSKTIEGLPAPVRAVVTART